jgi:YegS/Rv2252/BmrU family lipid kinase
VNKQAIWLIANPISGGGKSYKKTLQLLDSELDKQVYSPEVYLTEYVGHATEIAAEAVKNEVPIIVAIGGDGTINEIGKSLIHSNTALGIIPIGSGNGLARELGISLKPIKAIQALNTPINKKIDVGYANGIPFFCTAGIGFDAHCAEIFSKTKRRGLFNYFKIGFSEFWKYKPLSCTFGSDNYQIFGMTFGNARQFGNNAYITPTAIIDDGLIDCTIINPPSIFQAVSILGLLFSGNIHSSALSENYRATIFKVSSTQNLLIHCDGETLQLKTKNLTISVLEKGLKVII